MQKATFGGGSFLDMEAAFRIEGVTRAVGGYAKGAGKKEIVEPAEAVQIEFNPHTVSYEELLDLFWQNHDPTSINKQGTHEGVQFRSVIFYHTEDQKKAAHASKKKCNKSGFYKKPVVTEVTKLREFIPADQAGQTKEALVESDKK